MRQYFTQMRQEVGVRIVERVFGPDDKPSKVNYVDTTTLGDTEIKIRLSKFSLSNLNEKSAPPSAVHAGINTGLSFAGSGRGLFQCFSTILYVHLRDSMDKYIQDI